MKNHVYPFLFSLATLISVFLLQFLMKFADRLVGKGLSFWVIFKLITYSLGWIFVLAVPMAVLVATLMAFGKMAQDNEIAILKASGMSLYKMMVPPIIFSIIMAFLLIQFNNHIYPNTNYALRLLQQDISHKKPTLALVPGVFSQEVQNYSILSREIDQKNNELREVTIYDNSDPRVTNVITAQRGKIYFSTNQTKLIMELFNGEIHESNNRDSGPYRILKFKKHKIAMNAEQFSFQQSTPGGPRGDRELSAKDMLVRVDSLERVRKKLDAELNKRVAENLFINSVKNFSGTKQTIKSRKFILHRAKEKLNSDEALINSSLQRLKYNKEEINRYLVEIHKKYSIPVACIVFILIGAPLGTMTRKGGFGMAAGISLFFFLIYWAFLIGGEKLADRGLLSPFWGMWSANFLLGILGIILMVKSAKERITLSFDFLSKLLPKQFRMVRNDNQDT